MKRVEGDREEEDVPEQCCCIRMNEQDDNDNDEEFSTQYCWQTFQQGDDECVPVEKFPLRRRACGFFPLGARHANHEPDRVKVNYWCSIRLLTLLQGSWKESSDQDCDYTAFMHIVDPPLPDRELETVRLYLNRVLMCNPSTSSICRIPIDEEHSNKLLIIFPTILSPEMAQIHASFSQQFRDLGLTVRMFVGQFPPCTECSLVGQFRLSRRWRKRN